MVNHSGSRTLTLGVDPGLSGALALLDPKRNEVKDLIDMPIQYKKSGKGEIDFYKLASWVDNHSLYIRNAVIEDVHAMTYTDKSGQKRGQGAAASFTFGKSTGVVIGVLASFYLPMFFLKPAVWKFQMGLTGSKDLSRKRAVDLFPSEAPRFARKKDDGRAEALLLAYFGARSFA